jgi:DNA-binding transcriptional LysR family regulator
MGTMNAHLALTSLDWDDLRFFAALARHHTLALTAQTLGSTPARVERRLAHLERALGYALFTRGAGNFRLNSAGAAALAEAAQMEMAVCSLLQKRPGVT